MPETEAKSLHDIASLLTQNPNKSTDDAQPTQDDVGQDEQPVEQDIPLDEGNVDQHVDPDETPDITLDEGNDPDQGDEGDDLEGDDDADSDQPVFEISDDDLIEVKIDGEIQYRSIADAKKALAGDGAYDKRVKEATELRKQAQAEHTQIIERFSEAQRQFQGVLTKLEQGLFTPTVERPNPSLKQTNPDAYYRKYAEYQDEQERFAQGKEALNKLLKEQQDIVASQKEEYRKAQAQQLARALPDLADREKAPKMLEDMLNTAKAYGFTDEEIQSQMDHRYYVMVADLTKYKTARQGAVGKANTVKDLEGQSNKAPRKLRSGGTSLKAKARAAADRQKKAAEQARKSGKPKDVAQTLIRRG